MANATAPELVWMMCGFVSLVWDGAVHTANGCAHDLGAGTAHVALGVAGDPALFTEARRPLRRTRGPRALALSPRSAAPSRSPLSSAFSPRARAL